MRSRLVKTIQSTRVTRIENVPPDVALTDVEQRALMSVAEQAEPEINLRRAGLNPQAIARLQFLKWTVTRERSENV